jgi:hypothetical protein
VIGLEFDPVHTWDASFGLDRDRRGLHGDDKPMGAPVWQPAHLCEGLDGKARLICFAM